MKPDVGVVIGRFQTDNLHEGHRYLLNQVVNNHNNSIIFLGISKNGSKRDPLNFETRRHMVQGFYPNATILPLEDHGSDSEWVKSIDEKILEIYPNQNILMYGSRDSFIICYLSNGGKFKTKEIEQFGEFSGTESRKSISSTIKSSQDFRSGIIYGIVNQPPIVRTRVNVIVGYANCSKVIFNSKTGLHYASAFVDNETSSYEDLIEKLGFFQSKVKLIGTSMNPIPDKNGDKIMDVYYLIEPLNGKDYFNLDCEWVDTQDLGNFIQDIPTRNLIRNYLIKSMIKSIEVFPESQVYTINDDGSIDTSSIYINHISRSFPIKVDKCLTIHAGSSDFSSFDGFPRIVESFIDVANNPHLYSFKGFPEYCGHVYLGGTPLREIYSLNMKTEFIHLLNEYDAIRGKSIVKKRLERALEESGGRVPEEYNFEYFNLI